jgi:hypothetical protein
LIDAIKFDDVAQIHLRNNQIHFTQQELYILQLFAARYGNCKQINMFCVSKILNIEDNEHYRRAIIYARKFGHVQIARQIMTREVLSLAFKDKGIKVNLCDFWPS